MAIAIGAAPAFFTWRTVFRDFNGNEITKTTLLDGSTDDTHLLQLITDLDALSNGHILKSDFNSRQVTGQKSSASNALYPQVADLAVLTFSKTNPVDASKTISKSFLIPCIIYSGVVNADLSLNDGVSPGTGSLGAQLGRLIANLTAYLNVRGADGTYYPGSWTYLSSESKKISAPLA